MNTNQTTENTVTPASRKLLAQYKETVAYYRDMADSESRLEARYRALHGCQHVADRHRDKVDHALEMAGLFSRQAARLEAETGERA